MVAQAHRAFSPEKKGAKYFPKSETRIKEVDYIKQQALESKSSANTKPELQAMVEENNEIIDILSVLDVRSMSRSELIDCDRKIEARIREIEG